MYYNFYDIQNDYVYKFKNDSLRSETTAGWAAELYHERNKGYSASSPPIYVFAIPSPALCSANPATDTLVNNQIIDGNFLQGYLNEDLRLWRDRVIINAGVTQTYWYQQITDYLRNSSYGTSPNRAAKNFGVNFQPVPDVAIYYGHSEAGIQVNNPPTAGQPNPDLQWGIQNEEGLRFKLLGGRAICSVDHYDLSQSNNAITNPALFSNPPPTVVPPSLLESRIARGWEYEINVPISEELSLIANATNFRNRSPYGVPFRGTSECSGAAWLYYSLRQGPLQGLSFGASYSYQGKRPGDTASGVTAASTPTDQIPNQPTFYIPAYALVNLSAAYHFDHHWKISLFVDNVLNRTYYAESLNRNAVYPGIPINPRGSISYSF